LSSGYGYNDFGELEVRPMGSGSEKFTYDILGAVTSRNFPSETYLYTADGERIYTLYYQPGIPNREEWLLRDLGGGALTLFEKNDLAGGGETWSWKKDYIYRDDFLLGVATSEAAANRKEQHFTLDHLGNPRLTTDKFGSSTPIAVRHFYGYGEEYGPAVQDGEKLRYTAHERAVGAAGAADDLDYMHARYRSPFLGRFNTPDPIASADPKFPHTWNRYTYAGGNPLHYVDPDGRAMVARNQFITHRSLEFNGLVRDELGNNLRRNLPFGGGLLGFAVDVVAGSLFARNDQELVMNSLPAPAVLKGAQLEARVVEALGSSVVGRPGAKVLANRVLAEVDVETSALIIEVTGGIGKDKVAQYTERLAAGKAGNPSGKEVVLYGPRVGLIVTRNLEALGVKVFKSLEALKAYVKKSEAK
jgi:RHS repeat-associated protein